MTDLIKSYVDSAIKHGNATESGNSEAANAAYDQLNVAFRQLVSTGRRRELLELLDHDVLAVRFWAAYHSLAIAPERAEATLVSASAEPGLVGFSAEMTLQEWRNGKLIVP